jgi:diguanylate cyclase (GGDEF)-like protein/putative nucleotidyltransferase with HDIG domain
MALRVKVLITFMLVLGACSVRWSADYPGHAWLRFAVYLIAVMLSSGMKVAMPKGDGTASVNFPFILLGIVQLSPGQTMAMAALSVLAQCRFKVIKSFTLVQVAFNVANTVTATAIAWATFDFARNLHAEMAPALSVAAVAYFLANTIPVAMVIGWLQGENPVRLWRREFPWYLPFYLVGAILAAAANLISVKVGWTTSLLLIPVIYTIFRAYQTQMATIRAREKHLEETEALHLRTIEGLAMAIEAKDHNTHDHLVRTRVYVSEIGAALNLDALEMQALLTASFLHDIGKLAVPEYIINKPGKLTPEEFDKIKIHPVVGADILERVRFPYPVVPIVRSHHEAWDGSGYPDGLKGEEIPIGARILTVVDCFDALASDRPYRRAMPTEEAMALVKSKAGSQFDPAVVKILEERYVELEGKARTQGGGIAPLNTDITVRRGEAPGAGFQKDSSSEKSAADGDENSVTSKESLTLIAAANHEAQSIFDMTQMLGSALSSDETISIMSARLRRLVPFDCFVIYLKAEESVGIHYVDGECAGRFTTARIPLGEGLSGWVSQNTKPILNGNPTVEPNYVASGGPSKALSSALSIPLIDASGEVFGALTVYSATVDAFSRDHLRMLLAMEAKLSLTLKSLLRARSEASDERLDSVTQLPNLRQMFMEAEDKLIAARQSDRGFAVVICGLNNFAEVSHLYGKEMSELLLQRMGEGFCSSFGPPDMVARTGGQEFGFLLSMANQHNASMQVDAIVQSVRKTCNELSLNLEMNVSTGTAFFPGDGATAEALLATASRRMHLHQRSLQKQEPKRGKVLSLELAASA